MTIPRSRAWDAAIVAMIFLATSWWGTYSVRAFTAAGRPPGMYNEQFEPAVMVACGRGFHEAVSAPAAVTRFLSARDPEFSCASLPADLKLRDGQPAQGSWLYLMLLVAAAWRVLGISWGGLAPLLGAFFGMAGACAFLVFRFGMGRLPAVLCSAALSLSSLQILSLPSFRDYAKAPFVFAMLAITLALALRSLRARNIIALCACYGALAGLGYGIKPDPIIQVPSFVVTVLVFLPGSWRGRLGLKAAALIVAAAAFALSIWPVLRATPPSTSSLWHVAILGLMPEYDRALGVENSTYQFGVTGSDEFVELATADYGRRIHPDRPSATLGSAGYAAVTRAYGLEIISAFPADMVTRGLASIVRIPEVPFGWPLPPLPGLLDRVFAVRERILTPLYGCGLLLTIGAIAAVALVHPREGLFLAFLYAYTAAYPAIEYQNRSFFHLEIIGWFAAGFVVWRLFLWAKHRTIAVAGVSRRDLIRRAAVGALAVGLSIGGLAALRLYQAQTVRRTINGYLRAPVHPLLLDQGDTGQVHTAVIGEFAEASRKPDWARLLRIELNGPACSGGMIAYQYDRASPFRNLSTTVALTPARVAGSDRVILFEPVYTGFASLDVYHAGGDCLRSVGEVGGLGDEPIWLPLMLSANWQQRPLYQSIRTRENIH